MSNEERDGHLGEVIDRRVQVYGDPVVTFARIAQVWSGIIGHEIQPVEVPLMMAGMKMVRAQVMPDYSDNSDDIDGYLDIFRKIVGEDMIHARTVNEFIEKKWGRSDCTCESLGIGKPPWHKNCPQHGDVPIPYQVVDHAACTMLGDHDLSTRHRYDECPVVQP